MSDTPLSARLRLVLRKLEDVQAIVLDAEPGEDWYEIDNALHEIDLELKHIIDFVLPKASA
jgi:methyl coenzyme M reductase gamma subunit